MTALGMTALHLSIAEFKFIHNFVDLQQAARCRNYFWYRHPRRSFLFHTLGTQRRIVIYIRDGKFLTYTQNCEQKAIIGTVKSSLKIPPRHNGVVPIKITGQVIKEHMAYFITDDNSTKGRDPNINIVNSIHKIKGRTSVNILVSNYTNKHITFNKGEYIGCLEPTITDDNNRWFRNSLNS